MAKGINTHTVKRQLREDAEKLHPWPSEVGIGPDRAAVNVYNKAQLQRSYRKWTPIDLIELARASKLIVLADIEFETYMSEGVVIRGGRHGNTPVENPRGRAVATLNSAINAILRRLGVTSMSTSTKQTIAAEAEVERDMRDKTDLGSEADDGLLN